MTFTTINFKYNGLDEVQQLAPLVEQKFEAFEKYVKEGASVTCDFEFEKVAPQQSGDIYRTEANLMIDGTLYRAEATEASFEKSIDELRDELDKELRRAKSKQVTMDKQAGRSAKEQMLEQGIS